MKFSFATNQQYDFVIKRGDTEVARWSLGQTFVQRRIDLILSPGKSFTFNTRWLQKDQNQNFVPPGQYQIVGVFVLKDDPVEVTLEFQRVR